MQKFLGLIAEREALVANQWAATEAGLKIIPNDDERRRALDPFTRIRSGLIQMSAALSRQMADSYSETRAQRPIQQTTSTAFKLLAKKNLA
jgi:hypothetical protein